MSDNKLFDRHFIWLATHDEEFLRRFSKLIFPDSYDLPEERWLLQQALDFWNQNKAPLHQDALAMLLEAKKEDKKFDKDTVVDLYDADVPDDSLRGFLHQMSEKVLRERLSLLIMGEYAESLKAGDLEGAVSVLSNGVVELSRTMDGEPITDAVRDLDQVFDEIKDMFRQDGRTIPTGVPSVDITMQGGARPGELCLYVAPPGAGKSQWLVSVSREAWLANQNVFYASFEMSKPRVYARFLSAIARLDSQELHNHVQMAKERIRKLVATKEITARFVVQRWPDSGATVSEIRASIKSAEEEFDCKFDLIVVDYGDIVRPEKKSDRGRVDDQAEVYRQLRALAIMLDVPVWTASQANRAALRQRVITIENLADSFDKAKIADFIICPVSNAGREGDEYRATVHGEG